jgi:glycosyltransferase involved in cell wall biosynthesis
MRVLHATASLDLSSGGPARSVPQLAAGIARAGHDVGIWCSGSVPSRLQELGGTESLRAQVFSGSFAAALDQFGAVDVVHDHGIWAPCHRAVAKECLRRSVPRVVSPRGMLEPWALRHKRWRKKLAWRLYQWRELQEAAALHATAESEAGQLRALGFRQPILVLPNGVTFPETMMRGGLVERQLHNVGEADGFAQQPRTALFLGRIHPIKGLPMLVEAWAKVRPEGWRMRVVGPDESGHRAKIRSLVDRAGLADQWIFDDPLQGEEKWAAMRQADLFILPSFSENFGIAVAEALGAGVPVVTTTGTPWSGLVENRCGWWVAPKTIEFAGALRNATSLPDDALRAMGRRGSAWVRRHFAWPDIAEQMIAGYTKMLEEGRCPLE